MTYKFEIRIAMLGYVSAGKTTVINALLRDQFGQVGMKRTTAGVNYFRLHHSPPPPAAGLPSPAKEVSIVEAQNSVINDAYRTAASTLQEISSDNLQLRESADVQVKLFDVHVREPLCEMRPDTKLVLVDIPGINEAGADGKYRTYVRDHWQDFDCVVVVMDGRQGANTEEQVQLLDFVRENNNKTRDVPVVILCNKVDDPEDPEQEELVKECQEEVRRIFGGTKRRPASRVTFVPTSAEFAYIYRTAALMTLEQFQEFDMNLISRLGRREIGWKWSSMGQDKRLRLAYAAASDKESYSDRMQATNFHEVLRALTSIVGGPDTQLTLIQKQIDVTLRGLSPEKNLVRQIRGVFDKRHALGHPTDDLPAFFWSAYEKCQSLALREFNKCPTAVDGLVKPLNELIAYYKFAKVNGLKCEQDKCIVRSKLLISRQVGTVLSKEASMKEDCAAGTGNGGIFWGTLHPFDWIRIAQSLLLLAANMHFVEEFGKQKMLLEAMAVKWTLVSRSEPTFGDCPSCKAHSQLDFNRFCGSCKTFFSPNDCGALKELFSSCTCSYCGRNKVEDNSGRCSSCASYGYSSGYQVSFGASNDVKASTVHLLCPNGCSSRLTVNGVCASCKLFVCLKGSLSVCKLCQCRVTGGLCSNASQCFFGRNKLKWKELPFGSLKEALGLTYDERSGSLKPKFPETYKSVVRLEVPDRLSDPKHFGHLAWLYCKFLSSLDQSESSAAAT
jgi:GTPase SAR1 family protein